MITAKESGLVPVSEQKAMRKNEKQVFTCEARIKISL
jgi:hypothetical protein